MSFDLKDCERFYVGAVIRGESDKGKIVDNEFGTEFEAKISMNHFNTNSNDSEFIEIIDSMIFELQLIKKIYESKK